MVAAWRYADFYVLPQILLLHGKFNQTLAIKMGKKTLRPKKYVYKCCFGGYIHIF